MANLETLYGLHAVQALLKSAPQRARELWVLRGRRDQRLAKILQLAESHGIPQKVVSRRELDAAAADGNHQGVALRAEVGQLFDERYLLALLEEPARPPFLLVLDGVTDPHNLGACLRSAEAAGVDAVVVPKDNSAGINATVRKVACGAAEVLPLIPVTNLSRTLKALQARSLWVMGAAGEASRSIFETDLKGPLALVLGAEGKGLRRLTRELCDGLVNIPMAGTVSSLNVSVATGICLFEAVRQRAAP
ncbi:23S rRNA (guanosine(2251)-2'-O)-methyltransferase RlmB [Exilibacterium tricleocarpae]|uniref:23S rRNA (guanosine-2'-O-)-methyltransferase RlmB n=1 Tax=Exilibacterium tricleocarpae TaxID=2591008 RepID=A0A545SQK8_9GAMM|nr:23S rRNA (guanosine(2251)-2'-O)-methyltransferase RlmB [Exilibacterium tricleocarpae]TQV67262.1 23S rRNA (guanosine(2251)-2'-O)-methyltransferase RlmB [Exilibacterium tricleocarpae]